MPPFSPVIVLTLLAALLCGAGVFVSLTRRWTRDRPRAALIDWSRGRRFKPRFDGQLPPALASLATLGPAVEAVMTRGPVTIARVSTSGRGGEGRRAWHLLVRDTAVARTPAALRPAGAAYSVVDLFTLPSFPAVLTPDRFAVHAADTAAARGLADSPAKGLLPPDVGLLVHGPHVTIDFSARPFDPVEIERMLAIADQVLPGLPGI